MTPEARLLEWGEDWARARGWWVENSAHRRNGWCVRVIDAAHLPGGFQVCRGGDDGFDGWTTLTPLQFWLWAHAVDSGRTDSQRCPDCEGGRWEVETAKTRDAGKAARWSRSRHDRGWHVITGKGHEHGVTVHQYSRPCPTCTGPAVECEVCHGIGEAPPLGLNYISRPLARVVCEAMPRGCGLPDGDHDPACWGGHRSDHERAFGCDPGDPAARLALGLHADALQAEGNPLGQALALWLHGVPCEACSGGDSDGPCDLGVGCDRYGACYAEVNGAPERCGRLCLACHGDGTALGAYVAAQFSAWVELVVQGGEIDLAVATAIEQHAKAR